MVLLEPTVWDQKTPMTREAAKFSGSKKDGNKMAQRSKAPRKCPPKGSRMSTMGRLAVPFRYLLGPTAGSNDQWVHRGCAGTNN